MDLYKFKITLHKEKPHQSISADIQSTTRGSPRWIIYNVDILRNNNLLAMSIWV